MENKEKQVKEEPKDPRQAECLSEAELAKVAGGTYQPPKAGQIDKGGKSW